LIDDFFKIIFDYKSRQTVSSVIDYIKKSLLQEFILENIGSRSITRHYIAQHVIKYIMEFSNILYNLQSNESKAVAVIDSMYAT